MSLSPISTLAALSFTCITITACGGGGGNGGGTPSTTIDTSGVNFQVASNLTRNLAVPAYEKFATSAANLNTTVNNSCTGTATEDAWKTAIADWQATLFYAVGPVAAGSNGVSANIYTLSVHDSAKTNLIDGEVTNLKNDPSHTIPSNISDFAHGLDALEYLLFSNPSDADRCNYAKLVAAEIKTNADSAVSSWKANNNKGITDFLTAKDSAAIAQIKSFFELIVEQTDKNLKDTKLGEATKLKNGGSCTNDACPELVEHRLAKTSYASLKANLSALKSVFTGNSGQGFDDIFAAANQTVKSDTFITNIDKAIASINSQGANSLFDQLTAMNNSTGRTDCDTTANAGNTNTTPGPCAIYREVKVLSDFLKTDFAAIVNLDVPGAVAGDGD